MITVYKTTLKIVDEQKVAIQEGSAIIKVAEYDGKITLWYVCDPEAPLTEETFYVISDGQQLPDTFPGRYVDTVQLTTAMPEPENPTEFVWHVFFKQKPNVQKPIVANPNDPGQAHTREGGK